ncbi:hypothetical protein F4677DRAFT_451454 [Hypoxylon crocopeplum]|nr:hypothetical protein F4677DRAFT_451454 [Hypoxylon crocopeplum]
MSDNTGTQNTSQNQSGGGGLLGSVVGGVDSVLTGGEKAKGQGGLLGGLGSATTEGVGNTAGSATEGVGNLGKDVTGTLDNTVKEVTGSGQGQRK